MRMMARCAGSSLTSGLFRYTTVSATYCKGFPLLWHSITWKGKERKGKKNILCTMLSTCWRASRHRQHCLLRSELCQIAPGRRPHAQIYDHNVLRSCGVI